MPLAFSHQGLGLLLEAGTLTSPTTWDSFVTDKDMMMRGLCPSASALRSLEVLPSWSAAPTVEILQPESVVSIKTDIQNTHC